jgi:hypothetical protein
VLSRLSRDVTVNVSLTLLGLKAVVAAMHALFCQVAGS